MSDEIHVDDVGTALVVTISEDGTAVDIGTATTKQIILQSPDGTTLTKTATLVTDGADGQMQYFTLSGDLDAAGVWKIQARVVLPTGEWRSSVEEFLVYENL